MLARVHLYPARTGASSTHLGSHRARLLPNTERLSPQQRARLPLSDREGVIRFRLEFTKARPEVADLLIELNAWRRILRMVGLVGQDPARYGGLGYGNLSLRLPSETRAEGQPRFVITGSQTGRFTDLGPEDFAVVVAWDIDENLVVARGPIQPSSETMTHAAIYGADEGIRCVMHAHSPDIWGRAHELGIPTTSAAATYGTPAMAREVERVVHAAPTRRIVVMEGHEDGVLAWGASVEATGITLLTTFVQAMQHGL